MHRLISWLFVIGWAAVIFAFSHQPAPVSKGISTTTTEIVIETIQLVNPEREYQVYELHTIVRKYAHLFLYTVLGMLFLHSLRIGTSLRWRHVWITLFFCTVYAISDEVHQLFVAGRGAEIRDVFIDAIGVVLGIALYGLGLKLWTSFVSKKETGRT